MTVEWSDDPRTFTARDWSSLVEADPEATVFHTPDYLKLYWEEFGAERLLLGFVGIGGDDVAAAAFDVRDGTAAWLGGFDVTDYMGPVGRPEERDEAAKELLVGLAGRDDWQDADLAGLPARSSWLPSLRRAAESAGLAHDVEDDDVAPYLRLPRTFEEYLAALPGKLRHEIRRKDRRLREAYPDVRLVDATPSTLPHDLDRFFEMHRSSRGEKGRFMAPHMELFFRRLADELLPEGRFRLALLEAGGTKMAAAVGFRDRNRFLLYNSAFDERYRAVSPGMVLVLELIRSAIEEGRRGFDFLKGDLPYKYRYGARGRRIVRLRLRREAR
ncbi:MAG TPA: GNAT family N-acetyltransferase [Actinomycetota bacterium]|nr:GNAT family N-acetyltransferase [Actinomycetota bacterium]